MKLSIATVAFTLLSTGCGTHPVNVSQGSPAPTGHHLSNSSTAFIKYGNVGYYKITNVTVPVVGKELGHLSKGRSHQDIWSNELPAGSSYYEIPGSSWRHAIAVRNKQGVDLKAVWHGSNPPT